MATDESRQNHSSDSKSSHHTVAATTTTPTAIISSNTSSSLLTTPSDALTALDATDLAVEHADLQAKHKDTLVLLARLQNSKATITFQIDVLKDRFDVGP